MHSMYSVQQKEQDVVVNERDILGTQLIRRNDELASLYEKVYISIEYLYKIYPAERARRRRQRKRCTRNIYIYLHTFINLYIYI